MTGHGVPSMRKRPGPPSSPAGFRLEVLRTPVADALNIMVSLGKVSNTLKCLTKPYQLDCGQYGRINRNLVFCGSDEKSARALSCIL